MISNGARGSSLKNKQNDQPNEQNNSNTLVVLISVAILVLLIAMVAIFSRAYTQARNIADQAAVADADKFISAVVQYRNFYTQMVVPRAGALGATFTHDYLSVTNALPLPATFIKDFGDFVSLDKETKVRMYSDLPFPWRGSDGGIRDDFEREAMQQARENPSLPYWRIEMQGSERILRYAKPDVLLSSCVNCHNSYPGTPKTDWKIGDVRGVFEVSRPLLNTESAIRTSFNETAILLLLLGVAVLGLLMLTLSRLKRALRTSHERMQQAQAITQELSAEMDARNHLHEALLREEQKLHAVFSAVADVIIVIDKKGVIQQVNNAVSNIFGYQPDELIGKNISLLAPEPYATAHDGYLQRYIETRQKRVIGYTRQLQGLHKDGSLVDIDLSVNEVDIGGDTLFAGVIRDVTLRIETEQALKVARDKAIDNVKAKSQFLTNISHELRTPLNGIMGMSQLLVEDLRDPEDKEQARIIQSSAQQLLTIVDDILDFSSMESAKFTLNPTVFYIQSWLFDSLAIHLQTAQDKGLTLSVTISDGVPAQVMGDAQRLSQIINKLVSNAIKFTREGRVHVQLDVGEVLPNGIQLKISVNDTGIGISEQALARLFQAFSQIDGSATRAYGGTGLGLVISRQLALMMHGDVVVSSTLGQGSTFIVSVVLPAVNEERLVGSRRLLTQSEKTDTHLVVAQTDYAATAASESPEKEIEMVVSMKILLIEDNIVNQKVAMALLKRLGYSVEVANNGQEGLDRLAAESFDAILMDCQMPVMDGYEASRQIRQHEVTSNEHIPIIALTAHAMKGDAEKCYESGMDDYLTKPINHGLLKERLEYWQSWLAERKKT
jgi:PAS domain S-box-containing protein